MSALLFVLPQVWGMADLSSVSTPGPQLVRPMPAQPVETNPDGNPDATRRKGPYALRLVKPEEYIAPRRRPEQVEYVGYEFYRKYTEAMLSRYLKLSLECGRVPSLLGRELFRGDVSHGVMHSFEDVVNFTIDMEGCIAALSRGQQHMIRRIALEEYSQAETATMLGMSLRVVIRRYALALDALTQVLLDRKMLEPLSTATL